MLLARPTWTSSVHKRTLRALLQSVRIAPIDYGMGRLNSGYKTARLAAPRLAYSESYSIQPLKEHPWQCQDGTFRLLGCRLHIKLVFTSDNLP